eukprot:1572992-Rhodomonas_salina.1
MASDLGWERRLPEHSREGSRRGGGWGRRPGRRRLAPPALSPASLPTRRLLPRAPCLERC